MPKKKRVTQSQKRVPNLEFIPIAESHVIPSIAKLAEYLASEQWRTEDRRAIVVIREDRGFVYVFGWVRFVNLAVGAVQIAQEIQRSGLTPELFRKLRDALNIRETTQDLLIRMGETPSRRAAVLKTRRVAKPEAGNLSGVWMPPAESERSAIGESLSEREEQQQQEQQQQQERQQQQEQPAATEYEVVSEWEKGHESLPEEEPDAAIGGAGEVAPPFFEPGEERPSRRGVEEFARPPSYPASQSFASDAVALPDVVQEESLRRTPHMKLSKEDPFSCGDKFEVAVYVDEKAAEPEELAEDVIIKAPKDVLEFPVTVYLIATDHFAIKGAQSQSLVIKRKESKSDSVRFSLEVIATPKSVRAGTIVAAFEYNGRPCGKVTRSVAVAPQSAPVGAQRTSTQSEKALTSSGSEGPRMEFLPDAQQPDMTITIISVGNDGRTFDVIVKTPLLEAYKAGVKDRWVLKDVSSAIVQGYFDQFTKDNITDQQRFDALQGAGDELFKSAPAHFQKAFWNIADRGLQLRSIFVVSDEPFIPWELMIPSRVKDGQDDIRDPLGAAYAVGRWVCGDNISPRQRLSFGECRVIAPDYKGQVPKKLPKADAEAKFVLSKIAGRQIAPAMYAAFEADMKAGGAPLLHFVCHGAAQTAVAQQIYFENSEIVSSVQLGGNRAFRAACRKNKPLIFLNACEVGRLQPALVGVGGFAQIFIDRGAHAVIAPLWSVKDDIAHDVALAFYEGIDKQPDRPFADIVREIRAKAYSNAAGSEDTYAAYCFYGDPLAHRIAA